MLVFFILITIFPANLFAINFSRMDASKDTLLFDYWKDVLEKINKDSIIISNSLTAHVPIYIDTFETKKNIEIIRNVDLEDIKNIVQENIGKRDIYYTDAHLPDLTQYYDVEIIGDRFRPEGLDEEFSVLKIDQISTDVLIETENDRYPAGFRQEKGNKVFCYQ